MFNRIGMYHLVQHIEEAQRRHATDAALRPAPFPEELRILARLAAVIVLGIGAVALVMSVVA